MIRTSLLLVTLSVAVSSIVHGQSVRTLPLQSHGMVYSFSRSLLYVAVAEEAPQRAGSITAVDPFTGVIGASVYLGGNPSAVAMSRDERYLYVGLWGGEIARIDLESFSIDLLFSTEATGLADLRLPIEIHVLPDRPGSIAVSVGQYGWGPREAVIAVFDDGIMRPEFVPAGLGVVRMTFGEDSRTVWGYSTASESFPLYRFTVDGAGIRLDSDWIIGLFFGWGTTLQFRDGLMYTSNGRIVDPQKRTIEGRYYSFEALFAGSFDIDWNRSRVYFPARSGHSFYVAEFDLKTFRRVGSFTSDDDPNWFDERRVPWTPEQTVLCGSEVLAMGGYAPDAPFITLFPTSLIKPLPIFERPAPQPMNSQIRRLPLLNNGIVYDSKRERILAATPNWAFDIGNSLVEINPLQGTIGDAHWIGADPWQMAVSDDHEYLYAGLYSGWAVSRFRLSTMQPELRVPLYYHHLFFGPIPARVNEILSVPGQPESFVVAKSALPGGEFDVIPRGVAAFDGATQRPTSVPELLWDGMALWNGVTSIQWSESGTLIYGFPDFREISFGPEGVEVASSAPGSSDMYLSTDAMRCQYDLCFTPGGAIIDAQGRERIGVFSFDLYSPDFYWADAIVPDLDRGLVYFLMYRGRPEVGARSITIEAYDVRTYQPAGSIKFEDADWPTGSFFIWGGDQLAFSTADEVILFPMSKLHNRPKGVPPTAAELRGDHHMAFPVLEEGVGRFTGYAVSNPGLEDASLQFATYPQTEVDKWYFPVQRGLMNLPAKGQWAHMGIEMFPEGDKTNHWVELTTNSASLGSFFLLKDGDALDGATAQMNPSRTIYFPRIVSGEKRFRGKTPLCEFYLINPNGYSVQVLLTLVGVERFPGHLARVQTRYVTLGAKGKFKTDIESMFFHYTQYVSAHLKVEVTSPRGGIFGFETIRLNDPETIVAFNALEPDETGRLYSAQLASGERVFTSLKLVNTSERPIGILLSAVADNGALFGAPVSFVLAADDSFERDVADIFNFPPDRLTVGSLKVEADGPGLVGDVVFGAPDDLEYAAALPLDNRPFRDAVFSHVANVPGFFTGLALFNPGDQSAAVTVRVIAASGSETGRADFILNAGQRLARLLPELVPSSAGQAGGYVRVESSQPLVGQQMFGGSDLKQLSAIPAQVLQ